VVAIEEDVNNVISSADLNIFHGRKITDNGSKAKVQSTPFYYEIEISDTYSKTKV
jgi:hypothetical protein